MADATLTWLGHASFRLDTPGGKRVYVDPFLNGNPTCHESETEPERVDLILLTHGHDDHVGDTVALYEKFKPRVIAPVELRWWLLSGAAVVTLVMALGSGLFALRSLRQVEPATLLR